jgi:DNA-binding IclR family transcriptional regulator
MLLLARSRPRATIPLLEGVDPMARSGPKAPDAAQGAAAVDRALTIVAALEAAGRPVSLADLSRITKLYKSTMLRLLASLIKAALVVRRPDQTYALGPFAFRLGRAFEATYHVREAIVPVLEWLVARGTESPSFHVWHDDDRRLCLFRIDSKHSTLDRVRAGDLLPIRQGAAGKVLRLYIRGTAGATGAIDLVQSSFGERDPACAAIATPVFGAGGELVGAVSLSGPRERFTESSIAKMSKSLLEGAATATLALGGDPVPRPRRRTARTT